MIWARTIRYRISNYRIDYERGWLSKSIDTLELWHVEDITFHQSFVDRIMRVNVHGVFLWAIPLTVLGFLVAWTLKELPLRTTLGEAPTEEEEAMREEAMMQAAHI